MNKRQRAILHELERGGKNVSELSANLGYIPEPSIRRSIQTLRQNGYNISFADPTTGVYRLGPSYIVVPFEVDGGNGLLNGSEPDLGDEL